MGEMRKEYRTLVGNLKKGLILKGLYVNGRIILILILKK
jgi:hypothetical protein